MHTHQQKLRLRNFARPFATKCIVQKNLLHKFSILQRTEYFLEQKMLGSFYIKGTLILTKQLALLKYLT